MQNRLNPTDPRDEKYRDWIFTVPNILCMARIVGSIAMLVLALLGLRYWFVGLFVALTVTDWIDGRLARLLQQRSDFGARLDSFADAALYAVLLLGIAALSRQTLLDELPWIAAAVGSYAVTTTAGLIKYRKVPSYHTLAAKRSQVVVLLAGVALVLEIAVWPMRVAAVLVTLTNIEATLLTLVLPAWQANVPSLWRVLSDRRNDSRQAPAALDGHLDE